MNLSPEELAIRVMRLASGIAQTGLTHNGTIITVMPRDPKTGLFVVTSHPPAADVREPVFESLDIEEALRHGDGLVEDHGWWA